MKLYGRTQQITTLALEIDITGNTRYGDLWVRFVPDIASTFTALKSIGLIFLEVEIKCNWYGSLTFYEGYPDGQGEKFDKVKENLKLALKGGDFMTFICCRDG